MVFQSSVILVYGASGTGKTSLINCGLASKFQPHDWLALMIRRGANINDSLEKILHSEGGQLSSIASDASYHDEWSDDSPNSAKELSKISQSIKAVYQKTFRPIYLIFDQFEELFILGTDSEMQTFIKTIQEILASDQPVKIIFAIREEYLGYLFEFERAVPQLMRKKLRIEPMNFEKVKQVILGASTYENSNVRLKPGEEDQLARGIFEKIKGKGKSLTIQLPFLQVFLDKFYLKITGDESRTAQAVFTMQVLNEMGEIGDILINFLDEQVTSISKNLKSHYPDLTQDMIWRMLSPFSTIEGTKEPIGKQGLYERLTGVNPKLIDELITAFTNSRILRYNDATDMYEIAHDALAKPISEKRSVEEKMLLEVKRLIKSQVAVKAEGREYFTERQLIFIESYLDKIKISNEETDWISKSKNYNLEQKEEQLKKQQDDLAKRKMQRVLSLSLVFLLLVIAGTITVAIKISNQSDEISKQKTEIEEALNKAKQALALERQNKILTAKAANDSLEIQKKSLASYGISQNKINTLTESELDIISDLNQQIYLLTSKIDKSFTIQYFPKLDDEDKAFLILKELGYKLEIKEVKDNMKNIATNCIWIGSNVNDNVDNVKLVAFCLMRAGIKLKAIKLFESPDGPKANLIQVGASAGSLANPDMSIEIINSAKKFDSNGIAK
ncbi:MAG: ATP-binding protein [Bacteroidetes bacterium]|nr:ATP-binding protein [Bacteroidota bacterium]